MKEPTKAPPTIAPVRPGPIRAGWAVDIGLSFLFGTILSAIVGGEGTSAEEVARRMSSSIELQVSQLLVGLSFTGLGGYVAAWVAKERHVQHAVAVGMLSLGFSVAVALTVPGELPLWLVVTGLLLTIPFAAFGGYYRRETEKK